MNPIARDFGQRRAGGRGRLRWTIALAAVAALLAGPAAAQFSRPAAEDPERSQLLPARQSSRPAEDPAATRPAQARSDTWGFTRMGLALGVVLILIFVVQRAWKRLGMPGLGTRSTGLLQVVSRLTISPRQQVLLLRVGRRCVLVASNGAQMNPLCEIGDPDEVAGLLGMEAVTRRESASSSFNSVLGTAIDEFDAQSQPSLPPQSDPPPSAHPQQADPELHATRQELTGLMERVRTLSKQFSQT